MPSPTPIGTCALLNWEDEPVSKAELGFSLEPEQWGHRYASEAIAAMQRFGFDVMGLEQIDALVWDGNERSIRFSSASATAGMRCSPTTTAMRSARSATSGGYILERTRTYTATSSSVDR